MSRYSEAEDDPDVFQSSGEEWKQEEEEKSSRRSSKRLSRKPRRKVVEVGSSDEDEEPSEEEEPKRKRSKNGVAKKTKPKNEEEDCSDEEKKDSSDSTEKVAVGVVGKGTHKKFIPKTIFSDDYATGSFVILKKDAQVGDPAKHPCIWRIDGKALLQKYEAFDEEGKVRHKNTSIYTGWSPMDKDLYAPVTVDVIQHNNQNLTVELHWDKLKEINVDSD